MRRLCKESKGSGHGEDEESGAIETEDEGELAKMGLNRAGKLSQDLHCAGSIALASLASCATRSSSSGVGASSSSR
jgi:hypothetical protein